MKKTMVVVLGILFSLLIAEKASADMYTFNFGNPKDVKTFADLVKAKFGLDIPLASIPSLPAVLTIDDKTLKATVQVSESVEKPADLPVEKLVQLLKDLIPAAKVEVKLPENLVAGNREKGVEVGQKLTGMPGAPEAPELPKPVKPERRERLKTPQAPPSMEREQQRRVQALGLHVGNHGMVESVSNPLSLTLGGKAPRGRR